jgi:hypothetical protein
MRRHCDQTGFSAPAARALGGERRNAVVAELVATVALTFGTAVAIIVVSAGLARADVGASVVGSDAGIFAFALLLGIAFIGLGGVAMLPRGRRRR